MQQEPGKKHGGAGNRKITCVRQPPFSLRLPGFDNRIEDNEGAD
jgi:hypothetical protein